MNNVNWFQAIKRVIQAGSTNVSPAYTDRRAAYEAWGEYYDNTIYDRESDGGKRDQINRQLGLYSATDIAGLYNPIAEVVDLYQNVFGGKFRSSTEDEADDNPNDIRLSSENPLLLPALDLLWKWTNINTQKQLLQRYAPLYGTCGIRIVAEDSDEPTRRRVYLKFEHPRIIRDVTTDERGNVTAIELEWEYAIGLGDDQKIVTIREVLTKEYFATYKVESSILGERLIPFDITIGAAVPDTRIPNPLGIVPYVLCQHQQDSGAFGYNAFYRTTSPIDRLNAQLSHIDTNILDHVKVQWLIAAAGAPPEKMSLDGTSVIYINTASAGEGPPPVVQPMTANLQLADAISRSKFQVELIEDRLPELKAIAGRFISGQSGDTIAQLRAPAEQRLSLAQANYEDALERASQIAVSWMVYLGIADVGTGMETPEAADRAYHEGYEDFTFNSRKLLIDATGDSATSTTQPAMSGAQTQTTQAQTIAQTPTTDDTTEQTTNGRP